ncbi:3'-5' exoribonuclease YhaM family protein [Clostridium botulinum]|uniref:3'-5' exoribonuclease YhaM family protein n=2 Tax=Clostridium botulinum TaxID=1491 RepID=UPI0003191856|nr:OB-fold nucleic acid binding domain-containing protein [Clostridium botulinum]KLU74970.1 CMP-binding protein [Clostridium botulinum V891]KOA77977.1 CMP-binding protein [Clostridium botulinum]KOA95103.1 CMP-binding protein [Clostridium botulinum]KOC34268.1 CMP-binding protein [Clostridium botulinum]MCD3201817.1 HD domain-containing protein [Clostridium botulinum C/D]
MDILVKPIEEFQANDKIDGFFLIKSAECRTASNSKKYLDFTIADKTGEINAKFWNYTEGDEDIYKPNVLIKVRGSVTLWQNNMQFKIDRIRLPKENENVNISDFVPSAPYSPENMYEEMMLYISKIKDEDIKNIINYILDENKHKIMHFPAAKKNHHAVRSGLLYHTTTMLKAGEKLSEVYTFINTDLLFGGIILHDFAKMDEMNSSELGIVDDYTIEGQLLGHIIEGVKNIEVAAQKVGADKEITMLLQHMVLSHHYEPEFGSPKRPMIPEAQMLHFLDVMDASLYDMHKAIGETNKGEFSNSIWSLDKRKIYRPLREDLQKI